MADVITDNQPQQSSAPAKMPNAVTVQPQAAQPGPNYGSKPNVAPPNVTGGPASFSDVTQSISDLMNSKTAMLSATEDSFLANKQVDDTATKAISDITTSTLGAYGNIQKAESLPDGAQGDLAQIIGLFNSDYNYKKQLTTIQMNEVKAAQIKNTAENIKNQNNLLPALLEKNAEVSKVIFDAQVQANNLAQGQMRITQKDIELRQGQARLKIEMSQEGRAQADFAIKNLSTAQMEAILPQAQAGKGPYAKYAGMIESRLTQEQTALQNLEKGNLALKAGNRQEFHDSMVDFTSNLPHDLVAAQMADSQKKGLPYVEFNTGTGKDGKPQLLQIPYNMVQEGLTKSIHLDQLATQSLAADYSERLDLIPKMQNMQKSTSAFISLDPRAAQFQTKLGSIYQNLNAKDPNSIRVTAQLIDGLKTDWDKVVADNAKKMNSKDAQAAVTTFGSTGKFDAQGGASVMADSGGVPALATSSKYKTMWNLYNIAIANEVNKQHMVAGPAPADSSDATSMLAMLMAKPNGKETLTRIGQNLLSDPNKVKPLRDAMKSNIQGTVVQGVLHQLAGQKNSNKIWSDILQHPDNYKTNGAPDVAKLFNAFEIETVKANANSNPIDLSETFLRSLGSYAANADNQQINDPTYTMQDHAAEAAIFGGNPISAVTGDLHYQLRQIASRARQEMQQRIQSDVTGKTQHEAAKASMFGPDLDAIMGPAGIMTDYVAQKIFKKTGKSPNDVPSATGTGLTASQVRAAYSGGQ
jgi:hypothetical protein